jgi:hypothetical protein
MKTILPYCQESHAKPIIGRDTVIPETTVSNSKGPRRHEEDRQLQFSSHRGSSAVLSFLAVAQFASQTDLTIGQVLSVPFDWAKLSS